MAGLEIVVPKGYEVQYESWKIAPGVRVGETLYCSGQLGLGANGTVPADPEAQIVNAFEHLGAVLEAAGSGFADVIELTSFHVGLRDQLDAFVRVRDRYLAKPYPAQTAVGVAELGIPGAIIEIRAIAVRAGGSRRA